MERLAPEAIATSSGVGSVKAPDANLHALELAGVTKRYGTATAVDRVSLNVTPGEFLTLLGPSGSGKSTTLMMIAGFLAPDAGDLVLFGRSMRGVAPEHRDVGMVFQNYALFPHMDVSANLAFPLRMRRRSRAEIARRIEQMLDLLRMREYGQRKPNQLSGGQQQRIALGRALIFEPRLLLMDEPLGALDRALRDELQREIKRVVASTGATTVYVTHDQSEAMGMSDRVCVMRAGTIAQLGTPEELYRRPLDTFVATFLGRANIAAGVVRGGDDGLTQVECTRLAGLTVRARSARSQAPGDAVTVVLRPEDIRLNDETARCSGTVTEEVFFGESIKRQVALGDDVLAVDDPLSRNLVGPGARVGVSAVDGWILPGA